MEMTNYTKDAINDAIYKVVTTQFKKDAKESHAIVEAVGYKIFKCDGSFKVRNPKTYRFVQVEFSHGYYSYNVRVLTVGGWEYFRTEDRLKAYDFVGQLETTREVYAEPIGDERSEALRKYSNIKRSRGMAIYYADKIKKTLEEIASLQQDIIRYTEYKIEYEANANEYRKEYGLI